MQKKMTIKNIDQLSDYILNNELTGKQLSQIIEKTLFVYYEVHRELDQDQKENIVKALRLMYKKYPSVRNRPLFI